MFLLQIDTIPLKAFKTGCAAKADPLWHEQRA